MFAFKAVSHYDLMDLRGYKWSVSFLLLKPGRVPGLSVTEALASRGLTSQGHSVEGR